jgi:hypothetical protein
VLELQDGVLVYVEDETSYELDLSVDDVIKRLAQLGYVVTDDDLDAIGFELLKITNYTLNYCNITQIPSIINPRLIDRVCGEFLYYKKNSGSLPGFNYDAVVKQIKEGDTTLVYAVGQGEDTPENRFDAFVKQLERGYDKWITPHRRLRW